MAGDDGQSSRRTGKRSRTKKKRTPTTVNKAEKAQNNLPKLETRNFNAMEKVPSNAPTMAIAPSDYEHIFHEAAQGPAPNAAPTPTSPSPQLPQLQLPTTNTINPMGPQRGPPVAQFQNQQQPTIRIPTMEPPPQTQNDQDYTQIGLGRYGAEVQVTPDGYTMLGHPIENNPQRRVALPAHIVRAGNQFSRAALLRVARYLASRADPGLGV